MKKQSLIIFIAVFLSCIFGGILIDKQVVNALEDDLKYSLLDGEITITSFYTEKMTFVIPSFIDGYPVTSIGDAAFKSCDSLTSVEIPTSVTSIGEYAFADCDNLIRIEIPSNVTSIGKGAFEDCYSLTSMNIPSGVTSIENYVFEGCRGLTSIEIPLGVTSIGEYAFAWCSSLESIEIPSSVTTIGAHAFCCDKFTNLVIPHNVTIIGEGAFDCCVELISIEIQSGVINIGKSAFADCDNLISIEIPSSVTSIGEYAFAWCDNLKSVKIQFGVTSIGDAAFEDCDKLTSVVIPDSVTNIGKEAFSGCNKLFNIEIPSSVTSIEERVFCYCWALTSIEIPSSVTSIGEYAFGNCYNLTSIKIPSRVTSIGEKAFYACHSLTSVVIPDSVTNIGKKAFYDCESLVSIEIPSSVIIIENSVFELCSSLESIEIPPSVTNIGEGAFQNCFRLTSIKIPSSVKSMAEDIFYGCERVVIYGYPNSIAEKYAKENGIPFKYLNGNSTLGEDLVIQCQSSIDLTVGETDYFKAYLYEDTYDKLDALVKETQWKSSNENIVKVHSNSFVMPTAATTYKGNLGEKSTWCASGIVSLTGVGEGEATITGTTSDGSTATVKVSVEKEEGKDEISNGVKLSSKASGKTSGNALKFFPGGYEIKDTIIPVSIKTTRNDDGTTTVKCSLGIGRSDLFDNETKWCQYKKSVDDFKKYGERANYMESLRKIWDGKCVTHADVSKFKKMPSYSLMGYYECILDANGKKISETGKIADSLEWKGSVSWQFVTPVGPFYINLTGSGKISGEIGPSYDCENKVLKIVDGNKKLEFSITVEGGYGVDKVVTVGAQGKASFPITLYPEPCAQFKASAGLHMKALFVFDYTYNLASYETVLWGKSESPGGGGIRSRSINVSPENGKFSEMNTFFAQSGTAWNRNVSEVPAFFSVRNTTPVTKKLDILQEGVLPSTIPLQADIGGKKVMVFQTYDDSRTTLNSTVLKYSVLENGIWSEPKAVLDDGCADLYADMKVVNGELVLVWQKEKAEITGDVSTDSDAVFSDFAANSEICMATFDDATNTFINPIFVTDNDECDSMPRICEKSDNIVIGWVRNDSNSIMQTEGTNKIYGVSWDGTVFSEEQIISEAPGTVNELLVYQDAEKNLQALYTGHSNGIAAVFDNSGTVIQEMSDAMMLSDEGTISALQMNGDEISCIANGTLYTYNVSLGSTEEELAGESPFGLAVKYCSNGDKSGYIWSEYDEEENNGKLMASMRTEEGFSEPICLYEQEGIIWRTFSPLLDENGEWEVLTNMYDTESDLNAIAIITKQEEEKIELSGAYIDENDVLEGKTAVNYFIQNTKDIPVYSTEISIILEDGTVITETVNKKINPGEAVADKVYMDIGNVDSLQQVEILVKSENQIDLDNATVTDTIGLSDVSVEGSITETDDMVAIKAVLKNEGENQATTGFSLYESPEKTKNLKRFDNIELESGESRKLEISLPKENLVYNENDAVYFTLEADVTGGDYYEDNNIAYVVLYKSANDNPNEDNPNKDDPNHSGEEQKPSDEQNPDNSGNGQNLPIGQQGDDTIKNIQVNQIIISGISKKIAAGKKIKLETTILPENVTDKSVTWISGNPKFAIVNGKGIVTAKKKGIGKTVIITATANDGSGIKADYKISIVKHAVKSIKLSAKNKTVMAGKNLKLNAVIKTTGKTANKTLKWSSSNEKYATVTNKGVVKTKKAGKGKTVKITAMATDGTGKKATIKIKIK